ncbi:MAG: VanZ family protein [Paludibacteraceae bacterium]|nr:VanZ family protein [Paludibacteraceae bacterium]
MRNRAKEFVLGYWRTAVVAVLILVFTMRPEPAKLAHDFFLFKIPHFDKAVHFFMFMLMAMATAVEFVFSGRRKYKSFPVRRSWLSIVVYPTLYGGLIELLQNYFVAQRDGDWVDFIADFAGTVVSFAVIVLYYKNKKHWIAN